MYRTVDFSKNFVENFKLNPLFSIYEVNTSHIALHKLYSSHCKENV